MINFYLKLYPPPIQTYDKYSDVYKAIDKYIRNGKHTNQTSLMKLTSSAEVPELHFECYEVCQFGETLTNPETYDMMSTKYAVIRIVWLGDRDRIRWNELGAEQYTPNVMIHALEISHKQFKELFDLFTKVNISIWPRYYPSAMMGLDGVDYELTFDGYFGIDVTYRWWSETDGTWKQLSESAMTAKYLIDTWIAEHEKSQRKS